MLKSSRIYCIILLISVIITLFIASPSFRSIFGFPIEMRILEGEIGRLSSWWPMDLYVSADKSGCVKIGGEMIDSGGLLLKSRDLEIEPTTTGNVRLEFRLFNIIPVKRLNLMVIPKVRVIPGGHAIGVLISSHGVIVVGHSSIFSTDGKRYEPAKEAGIRIGDVITRIQGHPVEEVGDVDLIIQREAARNELLEFEVRREGKIINLPVKPVKSGGAESGSQREKYRVGLYIRDNVAGVGTLTFYEPVSKRYGALGHIITDISTNRRMNVNDGKLVKAFIAGINAGAKGHPGEKIGSFDGKRDIIGNIEKNLESGIYGRLDIPLENPFYPEPVLVALAGQIQEGPAEIITVIEDYKLEKFEIEIEKVIPQKRRSTKGLVIRVTDPDLIRRTGGIIQGMSGSPIMQNGKLIGAVTHVFVSDPTRGYGIIAEWMIEESEVATYAGEDEAAA